MNQKQLLEQAEKKAGSKANLSKLTGLRLAFFYEWEKGVSMKFDVMVSVLEAVGLGLNVVEKKQNVPKMKNPPSPPEKKEFSKNCQCVLIDNKYIKRGKDGCEKSIENHKF
jgi:hypothetical protein